MIPPLRRLWEAVDVLFQADSRFVIGQVWESDVVLRQNSQGLWELRVHGEVYGVGGSPDMAAADAVDDLQETIRVLMRFVTGDPAVELPDQVDLLRFKKGD